MSPSGANPLSDILQRAGLRTDDSRVPKALAVVAVLILVVILLRWGFIGTGGDGLSFGEEAEAAAAEGPGSDAGASSNKVLAVEEPSLVLVHVSGAVREPGVYKLNSQGRVNDALLAAGGFREDAAQDAVNLARGLVDGEQIHFPTTDEQAQGVVFSGDGASPASAGAASGLVNINTADAATLDTLPGVGPAIAARIIEYRDSHGPFSSVEEIKKVSGIGDAKYADLSSRIYV